MSQRKKTTVQSNLPSKPQLIRLTLMQLNQINGGAGDPSGGIPDSGPDGYHRN
ncbi:MAG: hypothetical protein QNJ72_08605 [Pleurocapsa sp. MO_226.B13]|nr:hypothetical protein [Pleurocapsa sp. MO_226.B13]